MRGLVLGCLIASRVVAVWGLAELRVESRTLSWREVPALITKSEVVVVATTIPPLQSLNRDIRPPLSFCSSPRFWQRGVLTGFYAGCLGRESRGGVGWAQSEITAFLEESSSSTSCIPRGRVRDAYTTCLARRRVAPVGDPSLVFGVRLASPACSRHSGPTRQEAR
jgi:hypothetical protein